MMPDAEAAKIALLSRIAVAIGIDPSNFFDPEPDLSQRVGLSDFEAALLMLRKSFVSISDADERRQSMATIHREIDRLNAFKANRGF